MIKREKYIEKIRPFYDSDLVKVITGVRRCGKSIVLLQVMDEIAKKSDNIIYLNFEKTSDLSKVNNSYLGIIDYVEKNRKKSKCYIFLDEVQLIENWQIAVKDLRLGNNSVFVTGSNSKLLSSEILNLLSGRFVDFRIRPFVYKEVLELAKQNGTSCSETDYLIWGGFPARFSFGNLESQKEYLDDLKQTIVYNDLIIRHKIKKDVSFKKIVDFVLMSNSRIVSARNIAKVIKNECQNISLNTVIKYLEYLKEAYIIDEIERYSNKTKRKLAYYYKIYDADVCFNSLGAANNRFDLDHNLENVVYNELVYMGYEVNTYVNDNKEIDFLAVKNGKEYFIQVAYSVLDEKAYKREFSAFNNLGQGAMKILITCDNVDYSTSLVKHIRFNDFVRMTDLA